MPRAGQLRKHEEDSLMTDKIDTSQWKIHLIRAIVLLCVLGVLWAILGLFESPPPETKSTKHAVAKIARGDPEAQPVGPFTVARAIIEGVIAIVLLGMWPAVARAGGALLRKLPVARVYGSWPNGQRDLVAIAACLIGAPLVGVVYQILRGRVSSLLPWLERLLVPAIAVLMVILVLVLVKAIVSLVEWSVQVMLGRVSCGSCDRKRIPRNAKYCPRCGEALAVPDDSDALENENA